MIFSFLILCEVKGQCPPEVVGPQSSCNPRCDYTITNFNQTQANNYSWSLYNAAGTLIQPTVIGMSSFTFFPTATNNYQLIVSYNSTTCNSTNNTTVIDIYSCCDPSIPLPINQRVNDATQTSIIGWSGTGTIIKNKIIVFGGNIEINNSIDFENCALYMQEGSQIVLKNQAELVLNNSTLQSSCGNMWKGIKLTEQSTLKVQNNSLIRDAQFAINLIDPNSLYLESNSQLRNNYIGIYSPSKTNSITFSNFIKGTFTITGGSTLNPFFNQNPAPINNNPLAGILLNDFDNFDLTVPGGNNFNIYNLNAGVVINRGTATFKNVRFDQIYRFNSYQSTTQFPFSGSSVFGSGKSSKPTTILVGGNLLNDRCTFTNGLYGVHLRGNAQCNVIGNSLTNFNTSIRINNCNNKPQNITGNTITDFLNGIYFINNPSSSALINISNNLFNSNILQLGLYNPAIWYNNFSPSKTNLLIQYNIINPISKANLRGCSNGITINNVLNPLTTNTTSLIDQNIIYLSQHQPDFIQNSTINYTGISLNQCGSILVEGNLVHRTSLSLNTDPLYPIQVTNPQFRLIGIDVNLTTLSTIMEIPVKLTPCFRL